MGLDVRIEAGTDRFDPGDERWMAQVSDLVSSLEQGVGGVRHERTTIPGAKGGTAEIILALGTSGAITAAVGYLRAWLDRDRSRSLDISYTVEGREEKVTLKGDNVDKTAINAVAEAMAARLAAT
jgi:hypothetical protein